MKLTLYLPNFRENVTVQELADLTRTAEELDFHSVWTLDRIVVPEASDRQADNLKRLQDAGMTLPMLWPPFKDLPVAKTLDGLKRLVEEILPKVNAG